MRTGLDAGLEPVPADAGLSAGSCAEAVPQTTPGDLHFQAHHAPEPERWALWTIAARPGIFYDRGVPSGKEALPMKLPDFPRSHLRIAVFLVLAAVFPGLVGAPSSQQAAAAPAAPAAPTFGSGLAVCPAVQPVTLNNPTVVTTCTQAGLQSALDQGGQITFNCGGGLVSIPLTTQLELSTTADTVLDGGGLVTLDGQGLTRILHKDWHDPNTVGTIAITLQNLRLVNGRAPGGATTGDISGGALAAGHPGTRVTIINATLENNRTTELTTADNQGGAVFVHNSYETVLAGSLFRDNLAGNGGAFGGIATGLIITNSLFENNQAVDDTSGGIVHGYGGAVHLDGVTNSYNPDSHHRVHVCGSVFRGNLAKRGGGAFSVVVSDNKGTLATYEKSVFENNRADGSNGEFGQGGAIYHIEDDHAGGVGEFNLEVKDSSFDNNSALKQGGALWVSILGHGRVANVTFTNNHTTAPFNTVGQGGAMAVTLGLIDISSSLFAYNHAAYQAGALHGGGTTNPNQVVTLYNSIFFNNTINIGQTLPSETEWQGFHTNRPMTDGGGNIQYPRYKPTYNNDVNNAITANPIYADPLLGSLGDNGGPTQTMPLLAGSPAIDAANPAACPVLDQRGYSRSGACDIGPYEYQGAPVSTNPQVYLPLVGQ